MMVTFCCWRGEEVLWRGDWLTLFCSSELVMNGIMLCSLDLAMSGSGELAPMNDVSLDRFEGL